MKVTQEATIVVPEFLLKNTLAQVAFDEHRMLAIVTPSMTDPNLGLQRGWGRDSRNLRYAPGVYMVLCSGFATLRPTLSVTEIMERSGRRQGSLKLAGYAHLVAIKQGLCSRIPEQGHWKSSTVLFLGTIFIEKSSGLLMVPALANGKPTFHSLSTTEENDRTDLAYAFIELIETEDDLPNHCIP